MTIAPWMWAVWALVGFSMEMLALWDHVPNNTLTATIVTYVPAVWVLMAAGWVLAHFTQAVKSRGKQR